MSESLIQKLQAIEFDGSDRRGAEVFKQAKNAFLHVIRQHTAAPDEDGTVDIEDVVNFRAEVNPSEISVVDEATLVDIGDKAVFAFCPQYQRFPDTEETVRLVVKALLPYLRTREPVLGNPYDQIENIIAEFGDKPAECLSIIGEHIGLANHHKNHPKAKRYVD